MKGALVASRYAKSLLDLSIEQSMLDQVNNDMLQLSEICDESKDFSNLLSSPIVHATKKIEIFNELFKSRMEPLSLSFIELVTKNSREGILHSIAESFIALFKKHNNIVDVILTSASPLDKESKEKIMSKIKASISGEIVLVEKIDPSILGGFIVNMEDKQIDSSVATQLTNLKNILLN